MSKVTSEEKIAIIGMGCRFPGGASSPEKYWDLLQNGRDAIIDVPEDRWDVKKYYDPDPEKPGKAYVMRGGFLQEPFNEFDAQFFGISSREAAILDPQQRLLLEVTWEALEDAGLIVSDLRGSRTGVYIGGFTLDNQNQQFHPFNRNTITTHTATSSSMTMLSNRLSYTFDFHGPSISVDTACSSSLVALHLACQGLLNHESDLAVSGGANVMLRPEYFITMCKGGFLSPDGLCKTFDARANGYVRGEGAGIVVLKRLSDALRDGDSIHALIVASGINQDGHTQGITLPSVQSQRELIQEVLGKANLAPSQIQYIEAHGTGTQAGDPIEAQSLGTILGQGRADDEYCFIGSVKTNIGHLEAAAGVAGFMKAVLAMKHQTIPPHLHVQTPNPAIDFAAMHLRIPRQLESWPRPQEPLYAAVNSFGYGGTNAHVIIEEAPASPHTRVLSSKHVSILPISAASDGALKQRARQVAEMIANGQPISDVAYTLARHHDHLPHRLAVVAHDAPSCGQAIDAFVNDHLSDTYSVGRTHDSHERCVVFVYTGMGAQWWGMGKELLEKEAIFRNTVMQCDEIWQRYANWSLLTLFSESSGEPMSDPQHAQPANFVLQVALTELLASYGVSPQAVIGHSVGELAAAYVTGTLSLEEALRLTWYRSQLQQHVAGEGAMLAVGLPVAEVERYLTPDLSIAAINSPVSTTLAGDPDALQRIAERLTARDVFNRYLKVHVAYHSYQMEPLATEFISRLQDLAAGAPDLPLYSTVTGERVAPGEQTCEYWWRNARRPVLLQRTLQRMFEDGYRSFLEIGPHPVLAQSIKECLQEAGIEGVTFSSLKRKQPEVGSLLLTVADLYTYGIGINWQRAYLQGNRVKLPPYPWEKEPLWAETEEARADRIGGKHEHPLIERVLGVPDPTWQGELSTFHHPYLSDHQIQETLIFPAAGYVELGLAIARQNGSATLEDLNLQRALVVDKSPVIQLKLDSPTGTFTVYSRPLDRQSDWTANASGRIVGSSFPHGAIDLEGWKAQCTIEQDVNTLYAHLNSRSMHYGAHFRSIQQIWMGEHEVLARIAPAPETFLNGYLIHPTILDAGFQSLIALLHDDGSHEAYVPVSIDRVCLYQSVEKGLWCYAQLKRQEKREVVGDLLFCDDAGNVVIAVRGLHLKSLGPTTSPQENFYELQWEEAEAPRVSADLSGHWLLFIDGTGVGDALLNTRGQHRFIRVRAGDRFERFSDVLFQLAPENPDHFLQLLDHIGKVDGVLFLWGLDLAHEEDEQDSEVQTGIRDGVALMHLIQALTQKPRAAWQRLCVVTSGLWAALSNETTYGVGQSVLWGMQRVVANEHPELKPLSIDLEADYPNIGQLITEFVAGSDETEIALRAGKRYAARLKRATKVEDEVALAGPSTSYMLKVTQPGRIDSLEFQESKRIPPGPHEVEVKVHASAVNFKDIMKAMDMLPESYLDRTYFGTELGLECVGEVIAIGEGVTHLRVGDAVVVPDPKGNFRSYATVPVDFIVPKPTGFAYEEATFIANWVAPYYGLHEVARLQKGERILIHAATGGVGLAAIQLARWKGAEIYATAGSEEKRVYLRSLGIEHVSDSRSLQFVDDILRWTNGEGVDVILNSLAGEALTHSFGLLAPYGRFIEIGKRDITENKPLPLAAFDRGLTFSAIDIDRMMVERPALFQRLEREVWQLMEHGTFKALPTIVYPAAEVKEAFRLVREARHMGKVVVQMQDQPVAYKQFSAEPIQIRPNSTYLITGGTGGFGLEVARWLASKGATNLVLASRHGNAFDEVQAVLSQLTARNIEVVVSQTDVSDERQVAQLLKRIRETMPTLRGVIHAAMVLDDAVLTRLDRAAFERVMAPKAAGAWHLHRQTLDLPLDCFVLFSSVSSLIGNAGQGNYVAANAFLDALAHYRRSRGLPAMSINWGMLREVGVAARNPEIVRHLEKLGISGLTVAAALAALDDLFQRNPVQVGAMDIDWKVWASSGSHSRCYEHLVSQQGKTGSGNAFTDILLQIPHSERQAHAEAFLLNHVAGVLRTSADRLDVQTSLDRFGIDSLMAVELSTAVCLETGVRFSTMLMMRGPTIAQLATELITELITEDDELLVDIEDMPESELDSLLELLAVQN